jgi:hypothetical protein
MDEDNSVMLIAGSGGAKSTFAGGLLQHVDNASGFSINSTIYGSKQDYDKRVREQMFTSSQYPAKTQDGYIARYELRGKSFSRPATTVNLIDLPGEGQEQAIEGGVDMLPLIRQIKKGNTGDPEDIKTEYENDIEPDFERGISPSSPDVWKTTFLHHYYSSDKAIFLLNLYKATEKSKDIAYDTEDIDHANEQFTDVAVIPIAVDWYGYDPESANMGFVTRILRQVITPSMRDQELLEYLTDRVNRGSVPKVAGILNFVETNREVDFFGVSVPDKGAPQTETGTLTADGRGGFEVKGFKRVIQWLEQ